MSQYEAILKHNSQLRVRGCCREEEFHRLKNQFQIWVSGAFSCWESSCGFRNGLYFHMMTLIWRRFFANHRSLGPWNCSVLVSVMSCIWRLGLNLLIKIKSAFAWQRFPFLQAFSTLYFSLFTKAGGGEFQGGSVVLIVC